MEVIVAIKFGLCLCVAVVAAFVPLLTSLELVQAFFQWRTKEQRVQLLCQDLKFIEEWIAKPKYDEDYMKCVEIENRFDDYVESIFMQWSLEEVRFYYGLIWHHFIE